jgi:hypothetical protein
MAASSLFDVCQIVEGGPIKVFFPDFGKISFVDVEKFMVPEGLWEWDIIGRGNILV